MGHATPGPPGGGMAVVSVDQGTGVHAGSLARPGRGPGPCLKEHTHTQMALFSTSNLRERESTINSSFSSIWQML